jgi:hypothetical protein
MATAPMPLADEAARIEENALYTAQANFVTAVWFDRLRLLLGVPATVLGVAAGATFVAERSTTVAAMLAFAASLLAALTTFLHPDRTAADHRTTGNAYLALQGAVRRFRTLDLAKVDAEEARTRLEELALRADELNGANHTGERAFRRARRKIVRGDLTHRVDAS